jgi:hypothetical protein
MLYHLIAAVDAPEAVGLAVAAGVPIAAADCGVPPSQVQRGLATLAGHQAAIDADELLRRQRVCALSVAAFCGHSRALAALLAAGADPNPAEPSGRRMWHPLAAAATSSLTDWRDGGRCPVASPRTAADMCQQLLAAGASVLAACGSSYSHQHWLSLLPPGNLPRLLLANLVSRLDGDPPGFRATRRQWQDLLQLAAQADDAAAFRRFAAALPPTMSQAELTGLASEAAATACFQGGRPRVMGCMAELAAGLDLDQLLQRMGLQGEALCPLAPHLLTALHGHLAAAARGGDLQGVQVLLAAGVPVTAAAVRSAVDGGALPALRLLLPALQPGEQAWAVRQPQGQPWFVPSELEVPLQYPCPMLGLLGWHAARVSPHSSARPEPPPPVLPVVSGGALFQANERMVCLP